MFSILRVVPIAQRLSIRTVNCDVNSRIKATWCHYIKKNTFIMRTRKCVHSKDIEYVLQIHGLDVWGMIPGIVKTYESIFSWKRGILFSFSIESFDKWNIFHRVFAFLWDLTKKYSQTDIWKNANILLLCQWHLLDCYTQNLNNLTFRE